MAREDAESERMLNDCRTIQIAASPDVVFERIRVMPNKFPVFKILDTRPFFFLRMVMVAGFKSAYEVASDKSRFEAMHDEGAEPLMVGATMGPFRLIEIERPARYFFKLRSPFFTCEAGYSLSPAGAGTVLSLDTIAERLNVRERLYWLLIKPVHIVMANKVLRNIKEAVESH